MANVKQISKLVIALFCIASLVIGGIVTAALTGVSYGGKIGDLNDKLSTCENKAPTIITETFTETVEVEAPSILDKAVATFMEAVKNKEDEAGNRIYIRGSYDFNEISKSRISNVYSVTNTEDTQTVIFTITLKFDDNIRVLQKKTYDVTVTYEDGEDTIVGCNPNIAI